MYTYFYTATALKWKNLFAPDKYKEIIISSLQFLSNEEGASLKILGFVVMPNHIHLLLTVKKPEDIKQFQLRFMKFTAQQIKFDLRKNHPKTLSLFKSTNGDREYQFWQRNAKIIELKGYPEINRVLDYIHDNPLSTKWMLASSPQAYKYSSANFYETGEKNFDFIEHIGVLEE
jgi:REP element-mobilizing transposase RayT